MFKFKLSSSIFLIILPELSKLKNAMGVQQEQKTNEAK